MNNLQITAVCPHPPIILPEIGGKELQIVEKTVKAVEKLSSKIVELDLDTIVIITPHSYFNQRYFSVYTDKNLFCSFANFRAPQVNFAYENDLSFIRGLEQLVQYRFEKLYRIPTGTLLDHGSGVPLYYLNKACYKGKIVVINYSARNIDDHLLFGKMIQNAIEKLDKKVGFIASADLSHRLTPNAPAGYDPQGQVFDELVVKSIENGNYDAIINMDQNIRVNAGECGFNSLMVAFGVIDSKPRSNEIISYEGPFGVGYAVAVL